MLPGKMSLGKNLIYLILLCYRLITQYTYLNLFLNIANLFFSRGIFLEQNFNS